MRQRYDILIVADPRFPGGTSSAVASEVLAAARAGYRIGLLPVKAAVLTRPHLFHPEIRARLADGSLDLVEPATAIDCGLVELHHPQLFTYLPQVPLRIRAAHRLLVVHHPPRDAEGGAFYDAVAIARTTEEALGGAVTWAPVGPLVRRQLERLPLPSAVTADDWVNILDPAPFAGDRRQPRCDFVRIGRHSRPDPLKWPESRAAVLEAYPGQAPFAVHVLGGGPFLETLMERRIPLNWLVQPFTPGGAARFLRTLDAYVYFHHPRWVEAFGRNVLEALAADCPLVLPHEFEPLFGEAATLCLRAEAPATARELVGDPVRLRRQVEAGRTLLARRFGPAVHVDRVRALIGPPQQRIARAAARQRHRTPTRVMFCTSNGVGLGHLTRCLAIARRLPPPIEPVFVSLSQGLRIVRDLGYPGEHLPYHASQDLDAATWNRSLRLSLENVLSAWRPRVFVFDGNTPYGGLLSALERQFGLFTVWSRRGLWRPGSSTVSLERAGTFDAVIEPGELAGDWDDGPTAGHRERARLVAPVRLLDGNEQLPRHLARDALGLSQDGKCLLLQLGSGNNFDFAAIARRCAELIGQRDDIRLAVVDSPIADAPVRLPGDVTRLQLYPLARYLPAFDAAVSAVGYNAFHELVLAGVPTLFVPNEHPMMDNQLLRARYAERRGLGLALRSVDVYQLRDKLGMLLDPEIAAEMRGHMARLDQTNGAYEAARLVGEMAWIVRADRP